MSNDDQIASGGVLFLIGFLIVVFAIGIDSPILRRIVVTIGAIIFAIPVLKLLVIFIAA